MSLQEDALRLAEIDRSVIRGLMKSSIETVGPALCAYFELRKSIKKHLLDESVVVIDDPIAADVLYKICCGEGLQTDKLMERLEQESGEEISIDKLDDVELEELRDLLYGWFSHYEYVEALYEVRPLILRSSVPKSFSNLVRQIKDSYAFQNYDAVYGLCRTLVEASARDICVRRQLLSSQGEKFDMFDKISWNALSWTVASEPLREQLRSLYRRLCDVLHARSSAGTKAEARRTFEETLQVIERLYEQHGL